jgi:formylglycine-generating enzyme required for sulfatase activity
MFSLAKQKAITTGLRILTAALGLGMLVQCHDAVSSTDSAPLDAAEAGAPDGPVVDTGAGAPDPDLTQSDAALSVPGTWAFIAKGTFTMGSPASEPCRETFGGEETQHQVSLTHSFEIQTTEVTQGQFMGLMGYNPSWFGPNGYGANCGTTCPVENVSWHDAVAYCNALSMKAGKTPCYSCADSGKYLRCQLATAYFGQKFYDCPGYRLPTEAEWEYAYRAGTKTAYYSGANDESECYKCFSKGDANADKIGWYCSNTSNTHPMAQKQMNAWGLYDMAGNVWEWCHDWFQESLGSEAVTDPEVPAHGVYRVLRGGSWQYEADHMRAAHRSHYTPTYRHSAIGFRCARGLP